MILKIDLPLQMTEKIAVEVGAKNHFQKNAKIAKNRFFQMHFMTPSKKVGPNLKTDSERFLSEFYENGPKN